MMSLSGVPIWADAYHTDNHLCLMKLFYKNEKNTTVDPTNEELIKFLKEVDTQKIVEFTTDTCIPGQTTPWSVIVESKNR